MTKTGSALMPGMLIELVYAHFIHSRLGRVACMHSRCADTSTLTTAYCILGPTCCTLVFGSDPCVLLRQLHRASFLQKPA